MAESHTNGAAAPATEAIAPLSISHRLLAWARSKRPTPATAAGRSIFAPAIPPPGVVPRGAATMAMDAGLNGSTEWAHAQMLAAFYNDGLAFLGYPVLAELAQRGEYRRLGEVMASEMTREWIELKSAAEEDKSAEIKAIYDELKRLGAQDAFRKLAEQDAFFGRAHLYLDTGDTDKPDELTTPIGYGRDAVSQAKIGKGGLKALRTIEAVWCYPIDYNSSDPLRADWYKPQNWFVMGKRIHATRLLTIIGREVPDLLKPAYSFGGLPLSQMAKTYIDKWVLTRDSVADLIHSFSVSGIKTNLAATLQRDGEEALFRRLDFFIENRDNRALFALDKDTEEFFNVSTPISGLSELQAQSQEHVCSISGLPLIKYTGLTPSGLNASSEGELRSFYDWIKAYQEQVFREPLTRVIDFVQMSLFDRVDPDIIFDFKSLWQLDDAGKAAVEKTKADIHSEYEQMGAISNVEVRRVLATDPDSPYAALSLDPDELPEPPGMPVPEMPGMPGVRPGAPGQPGQRSGGGPSIGSATSVRSPAGGSRDPLAGRPESRASAFGVGDQADNFETLDPDLRAIALALPEAAPANMFRDIFAIQASRGDHAMSDGAEPPAEPV